MKETRGTKLLAIAIASVCAASSWSLFAAWRYAPLERYSALVFLVWATPLILYLIFWSQKFERRWNELAFYLALFCVLVGQLGSLNAIKYIGFSFALAGFLPPLLAAYFWAIAGVAWMPISGWVGSHYFPEQLWLIRFLTAAAAAGIVTVNLWRHKK